MGNARMEKQPESQKSFRCRIRSGAPCREALSQLDTDTSSPEHMHSAGLALNPSHLSQVGEQTEPS